MMLKETPRQIEKIFIFEVKLSFEIGTNAIINIIKESNLFHGKKFLFFILPPIFIKKLI